MVPGLRGSGDLRHRSHEDAEQSDCCQAGQGRKHVLLCRSDPIRTSFSFCPQVKSVHCRPGETVGEGDLLVELE